MNVMKMMSMTFFLFSIACSSQDKSQFNLEEVSYTASTRGSLVIITAIHEKISYNETSRELSDDQWNRMVLAVNTIDVKDLHTHTAPSQKRFSDAALTATLKLKVNDEWYSSQEFDHGNPPEVLKNIISYLFDLAGIRTD